MEVGGGLAAAARGYPEIALTEILREQAKSGEPEGAARTLALYPGPQEDKDWRLLRRAHRRAYDLSGVEAAPGGMQSVERARLLLSERRVQEALALADSWKHRPDGMGAFDLVELALDAAHLTDPVEHDPFGEDD